MIADIWWLMPEAGREAFMRHILILQAACVTAGLAFVQPAAADPSVKELAARAGVARDRDVDALGPSIPDRRQERQTDDDRRRAAIAAGRVGSAAGRHSHARLGRPGTARGVLAKILNEMGIASFRVDSFSGRGLTGVSANQAMLGRFKMILDAYRAQNVLSATHASP